MNTYDENNIFAKILRGEIPCKKIYENEYVLCFEDIAPAAPVHLLVIPKQFYQNYEAFVKNATAEYVSEFFKSVTIITDLLKLSDFRLITNNGSEVGQSVFHFHLHILAGKKLEHLV